MSWQAAAIALFAVWSISAEYRSYQADRDVVAILDRLSVLERDRLASVAFDRSMIAWIEDVQANARATKYTNGSIVPRSVSYGPPDRHNGHTAASSRLRGYQGGED